VRLSYTKISLFIFFSVFVFSGVHLSTNNIQAESSQRIAIHRGTVNVYALTEEEVGRQRQVCRDEGIANGWTTEEFEACLNKVDQQIAADNADVDVLEQGIRGIIYYIFVVPMGWFAMLGAKLTNAFVNPEIFNNVFTKENNDRLYALWAFVRDILNIFLILVLLLSAFATIFQIQKWHLKNTLLMIVIMALLTNFSWPITRMFIDIGNITMYHFYDMAFNKKGIIATAEDAGVGKEQEYDSIAKAMAKGGNIIEILSGDYKEKNTRVGEMLLRGIFLFLFAIVFFTTAIIFLLRLVLFVILLVFSPVGFIAAAFPSTRQYASQWWDAMLKWTFIGPIMVFMIYLATQFMQIINTSNSIDGQTSDGGFLAGNISNSVSYVAALVILWSAIIVGNKLGGSLAGAVTSRATRFAKWGGRKIAGTYWGGAKGIGRLADAITLRSASNAYGAGKSVVTRFKNLTEASKLRTREAREEAEAESLTEFGGRFGGDKFALEKLRAKQANAYIKDHLADQVDIKTASGMLSEMSPAEAQQTIKGRALQKFIASNKDLQHLDKDTARNLAQSLKDKKVSDATKPAIESAIRKTGNADTLKTVYEEKFADEVVKKLDAESLAKSAQLLKDAAENLNSPEGQAITNKLIFPEFKKDFLKHAGNQGLDPYVVAKLIQKTSSPTNSATDTPPEDYVDRLRKAGL